MVMVNATNKIGQGQTADLIFNPAGYHNNVMQNITLDSLREETMRTFVIAFIAALIALPAAAEQQINLKKAPGVDKVEANCQACHSLAYIPMNSPFINAAGWTAEVNKMIKVMGAPIDDADAKAIIDYLAKNYGT